LNSAKKKVRFANRLVQDSPKPKHKPSQFLRFGSFNVPLDQAPKNFSGFSFGGSSSQSDVSISRVYKRLHVDLENCHVDGSFEHGSTVRRVTPCSSQPDFYPLSDQQAVNSNSNLVFYGPNLPCGKCLSPDHRASNCALPFRCKSCFRYGHKARYCFTASKPRIMWAPKSPAHPENVLGKENPNDHLDTRVETPDS
jgi:hypothetical protein